MRARVFSNQCIKGSYYKLIIRPYQKITSIPGQFIMLRPAEAAESGIFLPRPFSIHNLSENGNIEILYKVVGKGTGFFCRLDNKSEIDFLGPFGNGFQINGNVTSDEFLIVAGGIGVAPLVNLAGLIRDFYPGKPVKVFLGGRAETDLLCVDELNKYASEVIITTQDGSKGVTGYVTDGLEQYLQKNASEKKYSLYACGPNPMLSRISDIVGHLNIDTYFSLEATMACGMGLCMGCAIRKKGGGYYLVCKDGPVFKGDEVDLSDET